MFRTESYILDERKPNHTDNNDEAQDKVCVNKCKRLLLQKASKYFPYPTAGKMLENYVFPRKELITFCKYLWKRIYLCNFTRYYFRNVYIPNKDCVEKCPVGEYSIVVQSRLNFICKDHFESLHLVFHKC